MNIRDFWLWCAILLTLLAAACENDSLTARIDAQQKHINSLDSKVVQLEAYERARTYDAATYHYKPEKRQ